MNKTRLPIALILFLGVLAFPVALFCKTYKVGVNCQFPPYEFADSRGRILGANIDILNLIAKDSGIRFKYVSDDFSVIRDKFDHQEVELLAGMIMTPQRQLRYLFTVPHAFIHYSVFVRKGSTVLSNWKDLNGRQLLVESGSVVEEITAEKGLNVHFLLTPSFKEALEKLSCGTGDAVFMPKIQGYYYITQLQLYNLIEVQTLGESLPYCIALPLGYEGLQEKLNTSLNRLINHYRIRRIQNKWFGIYSSDVSTLDVHSRSYRLLLFAMFFGLSVMILFIYIMLKRFRNQKKYLSIQMVEHSNYETEYKQRHQLFVNGPIIFLKWNDFKREMFDSISENFSRFGYNPADLMSGKIKYRTIIHPDDLDRVLLERQKHLERQEFNFYQIYRIICPSENKDINAEVIVNTWHDRNTVLANVNTVIIRWIFDYMVVIPDEVPSTHHYYGYLLDISRQKQIEDELLKQHQAAQIAMNTKDIFLSGISVEINSPLNALIGLIKKIGDKDLEEDQASNLQTISESAWHLKQILQQIHDFLSILKGSIGSIPQWYVLKRLFDPIIDEFQVKIASKQIAFEYNEFQPSVLVYLDADWIQKIIRIIMDNAVKFTSEGKISLTVDLSLGKNHKDELLIIVSDTGIGIPEDKLQLIMEPFTQADETHTRKFGGIGLGLSIARNLVNQMSGNVSIDSELGAGTTVRLRLPVLTRS